MAKIKVMIAEDHKIFREALSERIPELSSRIEVIGAAEDGIKLLDALRENTSDIILLDIYMPEMDGWKVLETLKTEFPGVKTIMFSGEFSPGIVGQAILAGAVAFIDKWKSDENDIIAAIENVYDHGSYFNNIVSPEIMMEFKRKKNTLPVKEHLRFSNREKEVIGLICEGKQVKEIAASLNISDATVKHHKGNLFKKTDSTTSIDLLKYAITQGIYNVFKIRPQKRAS